MNLVTLVVRLVDLCRRGAVFVVLASLLATVGLGVYVAQNFKMNTNINDLLASDLAWREQEQALEKAFPQKVDRLVVVIDAKTPDAAEQAAADMAAKMATRPDLFTAVTRPDALPFFRKNGLLYLDLPELEENLNKMVEAQPLLGTLASDPSLKGLVAVLDMVLKGLEAGEVSYDLLDKPLTTIAEAVEKAGAGDTTPLAWQNLAGEAEAPKLRDIRKIILTKPVLNYGDLAPGSKARKEVRAMAEELGLTAAKGISVRMTGSVALNDEEFSSVAEGTEVATILSLLLVLTLLFFALRSWRLVLPILLTLVVGLVATTAFAMAAIGSLNLISVAFAVMFVGIAVDFGIQLGVRFREERHHQDDVAKAMVATARKIAAPLALAAATTTVGFLAFIPTDYKGVSELGMIAGAGMVLAFVLNITLLPALLSLFKPPAEPESVGYAWAAPVDRFLVTHARRLVPVIAVVALMAGLIASQIRFDVDPLNLKDKRTESVSTLFDLMQDPQATPYTIEILRPDQATAEATAQEIAQLPEVRLAMTLKSFLPEGQDEKLALIADTNTLLAPTLQPATVAPTPSDEEVFASLKKASDQLAALGADKQGASNLAAALAKVEAGHDLATLTRLHSVLVRGLERQLDTLRGVLRAEPVAMTDITDDLRRDWITEDGRAKIEVYPKGDARDPDVLKAFAQAVQKIAPDATGPAISLQESGKTVTGAFVKAGVLGILAIAFLAWLVLRRVGDVFLLILPLILAGILTLATMVLINLPLNFANIIALPLLLSLGVSYAIYFVSYWRSGEDGALQSSMARAVLFSASTTLVAFGSLSLSTHPGTAGMGELLTIALLYSLLCTFIVLPVLLARNRLSN